MASAKITCGLQERLAVKTLTAKTLHVDLRFLTMVAHKSVALAIRRFQDIVRDSLLGQRVVRSVISVKVDCAMPGLVKMLFRHNDDSLFGIHFEDVRFTVRVGSWQTAP